MHQIAIVGAGKIGSMIAELLVSSAIMRSRSSTARKLSWIGWRRARP